MGVRPRRLLQIDPTDAVLILHFFRGFFESELLSVRDQLGTLIASVCAMLASFGLIVPVLFNHKYRMLNALPTPALYHEAALADKLLFICLSMEFAAAGTLLTWQSLFPELQDFLILGPLPLKRLQLFRAKLVALLAFMTLLTVSVNVLPAFSLTAIMSGRWQPGNANLPVAILEVVALFVSCCAAGYFAFFALLAVQGLLMNVLPSYLFARWSVAMQWILLILTCAALPLTFWIPAMHTWIGSEPASLRWLPPAWFLALEEALPGTCDGTMRQLAGQGCWALCGAALAALLLYTLTYARNSDQLVNQPVRKHAGIRARWLTRVLHTAVRNPEEAAIFSFAVKSLLRSRIHKLLVAAIAGVCLALVLDGFVSLLIENAIHHRALQSHALVSAAFSAPLIVGYFLISGLLSVFSIPVELRANWIFRLSEVQVRYAAIAASEKLLFTLVIAPVSLLALLLLAAWLGFGAALAQAAFVFLMCLLLLQIRLWNWNRIPFTCPYLPAKRNVVQSLLLFSVALGVFAYLATDIELTLSRSVAGISVLLASLAVACLFMQVQRRRSWANGLLICFDEVPDPEVQTLELRGE